MTWRLLFAASLVLSATFGVLSVLVIQGVRKAFRLRAIEKARKELFAAVETTYAVDPSMPPVQTHTFYIREMRPEDWN